jgi:branched-chain amino acid transport system substrate-binding protein
MTGLNRRALLVSTLASPIVLRHALGDTPIKIGMPVALTGPGGEIGAQMRRGAEFWAKYTNAKGGLLNRPIQLVIQDTAGDPAACVRKAQDVVERDGCRLLYGMTYSSEALAVVPKLAEWNAIFMSSDNGDGRLTGSSFVPNFFRANTSGPMGTRAVSLYLRQAAYKGFFAIGMDYAWGHNSIGVFKDEVQRAGKNFIGDVYSPIGTKDFSTYIAKIRQSGADACFIVMQGDDNAAFLSQAKQYRLSDKVQLLTEIVDLNSIAATGEASVGLIGSSRYSFTFPGAANAEFVEMWKKEYNTLPDTFEGEQWQAGLVLAAGITKAGSIDADKLRPALENIEIDSIKGHVKIRACDHQGEQQGFMVKVVKKDGFDKPIPELIATFAAEQVTPGCGKMTYDS